MLGDPAATAHRWRRLCGCPATDRSIPADADPQAQLRQNISTTCSSCRKYQCRSGVRRRGQHRIGHQLTGQVMGHLPAAINPVQGCRRVGGVEMEVLLAGTAARCSSSGAAGSRPPPELRDQPEGCSAIAVAPTTRHRIEPDTGLENARQGRAESCAGSSLPITTGTGARHEVADPWSQP